MGLKTEKARIGEYEYAVTQLDAKKARRALARVAKYIGALQSGEGEEGFAKAMALLTEDDVDYFCDLFAEFTTVKIGKEEPNLDSIFGMHFAGKLDEMLQWLGFAAKVNFGAFFAKASAKAKALAAEAAKESSST